MVKTPEELEEEIRYLLEQSKWRGAGPHGRTINAIMNRVQMLRKKASRVFIKLVKAS